MGKDGTKNYENEIKHTFITSQERAFTVYSMALRVDKKM